MSLQQTHNEQAQDQINDQLKIKKKYYKRKQKIAADDIVKNNKHLLKYINDLKIRNTSSILEAYEKIGYFIRFLSTIGISNLDNISFAEIKKYEEHLAQRIELKEIKKSTAYSRLLVLGHFLRFLKTINVIHFNYNIPLRFKGVESIRDNEYVQNKERQIFLETIIKHNGRNLSRDFVISLLLIETGCRPIEVANLNMDHFNSIESTITFYSKKSGQRKVKIHPFVSKQLKLYLEERKHSPGTMMFLRYWGERITSGTISSVVRYYVKIAFGENRFSAKSLRHTWITNQLNNRNDIKAVARAAGHKHLVSTLHYFYRDAELLLEHSLPYNPMKGLDTSEL